MVAIDKILQILGRVAQARTALGLGNAATKDVGTTSGTVCAGDDARLSATSPYTTGDVKITLKTTADSGWVMMNDGTIGDGSSGGTTRANADTEALFTLLWNNVTNDAYCTVSGGRGLSAADDFAAHKTITLPRVLGRALCMSGAGSGLTSRALGLFTGDETVVLAETNLPSHYHIAPVRPDANGEPAVNAYGVSAATNGNLRSAAPASSYTAYFVNTSSTGSGTAHANIQPSIFLNLMIKL